MAGRSDDQRFCEPGNDTAVMSAWERFVDGSGPPATPCAASWKAPGSAAATTTWIRTS